jgi:hypothetical protein
MNPEAHAREIAANALAIAALDKRVEGLAVQKAPGLVAKNQDILRQFFDRRNVDALLCLPQRILREAPTKNIDRSDALRVMLGLAAYHEQAEMLSPGTFKLRGSDMIRSVAAAVVVSAVAFGALSVMSAPASAQTMTACEAKAVSKDGKPLSGAAKTASVNKCMRTYCEANAVSSTGKKLSGAAKASFLKKCEAG